MRFLLEKQVRHIFQFDIISAERIVSIELPLPEICRTGSDVTVVGWGGQMLVLQKVSAWANEFLRFTFICIYIDSIKLV